MDQEFTISPEIFIKNVEGYYGNYPPGMKRAVYGFIVHEKLGSDYLKRLWNHLVYTFSTEYKNIPDVAVLNRMCREVDEQPKPFTPVALLEEDPEALEDRKEEVGELLRDLLTTLKEKE